MIMAGLKPVSWKQFDKFLIEAGCQLVREKGDHRIYWRADLNRPVVVPKEKQLPVFVVKNNLRTLGIPVSEYLRMIR